MQALARWRHEAALAAILLLAALILWDTAADQTFARDDWAMILDRDLSLDGLLKPHNDQVAVLAALFWRTMLPVFGLDSYAPYLAIHIAANAACAVVVYVYVNRRLGPLVGLAAAALLALLGPAWETITWPFMIAFIASTAFGVSALLALDRHDRRGDLVAAGLILLSIASSNVGLPFAIAAAAQVVATRTGWFRRLVRVLAAPLSLYALWYLAYRGDLNAYRDSLPPQPRFLHLIEETPRFAFDLFAFGLGSLSGLPAGARVSLGVAAVVLILLRLLRAHPLPPAAWAAIAFSVAYFGGIAYTRYNHQAPDTSRYGYVSAVAVLLLAATMLPRPAAGRRVGAVIAAVAAVAVLTNLADLRKGDSIRNESVSIRAALLGVEIARERVDPAYQPPLFATHIPAGGYLQAVDDFGSPAYTRAELRRLPDPVRQVTDGVIFQALGAGFKPSSAAPPAAPAPAVSPAPDARVAAGANGCTRVTPTAAMGSAEVGGRDGLVVEAGAAEVELRARRFAAGYPEQTAGRVPPQQRQSFALPRDAAPEPWRLRLTSTAPFTVC